MVACTLMIEGTSSFCKYTLLEIQKIAKKYNAVFGGSENGLAGYNLTHAIAYIRDFMHEYNVIGETFETSIEWDKALIMAEAVKHELMSEYKKYMCSRPFLSYRVSQTYSTGVCVYFTFGFIKNEENTAEEGIEIYHILEKKMRKKMRDMGGSISHHHGIGQVKSYELDKNDKTTDVYFQIKKTFDSNSTFCENNYLHLR
jgi:alkyldihydroxyacetonephosphate synthase